MGEAKARGTPEQRKAWAIERNAIEAAEREAMLAKRRLARENSPEGRRRNAKFNRGLATFAAVAAIGYAYPIRTVEDLAKGRR